MNLFQFIFFGGFEIFEEVPFNGSDVTEIERQYFFSPVLYEVIQIPLKVVKRYTRKNK